MFTQNISQRNNKIFYEYPQFPTRFLSSIKSKNKKHKGK